MNAGRAWAQAESAVRGQVVAAADGSGLVEAAVVLKSAAGDESVQTRTDASGGFAFPNVRPGEYSLSVSSEGFRTRELRFVLAPREARAVTVPLEVGGLDVSVDVSGDLRPLPTTHSPSSTMLTIDRLEEMPVFQRTTLPDALVTAAPGMIRGHDDFVHIRGHEIALNPLINGVSFWENPHAVFSAGLSPDVIETTNVMTGGFPAEYGNRFGGVVDIVTKSGLRMENSGAAAVSAGGAGRARATGEFGGRRGSVGYFVAGSMFASDRFLSPPDPDAIHDSARGGGVFLQVDGNLGRAGALRTVLMGDGTNFEIPKTPQDVEIRPLANARQNTRQQTAIVGWTRVWEEVAVNASFYERWSRARLFPAAGPLTAQAQLERRLLTVGGKADATRVAGRHAVKAGVDVVRLRPEEDLSYRYDGYRQFTHLVGLPHIHVAGQEIAFSGAESGGQISGYAQDSIQIGRHVTADVGIRVDRYDLVVSTTHASPRANLALRVADRAVVHASYNHFFVPPPIEGVLSSSAGLTRSIQEIGIALPPLEPTVEDQFEAG
ncbi:MAG TPA: TonB-dependent receptor, partial [Planctomycetaceae bacterium]|nr:TonB-dependent receptor [Planctomycetaceae bacterium]